MRAFLIAALAGVFIALAAVASVAAPISYEGTISVGIPVTGDVPGGSVADSSLWDYWSFSGTAGQVVTIEGHRTTSAMDPGLSLFFGTTTDSAGVTYLDGGPNMTFLAFADDNIIPPHGVGGSFDDPQLLNFVLPSTGTYTIAMYDVLGDGPAPFSYELHVNPGPEPGTLLLLALGAAALLGRASAVERRFGSSLGRPHFDVLSANGLGKRRSW